MKVKRWFAVVVSVMMIVGLMPSMVFAEEETAYKDGSYTGTGTGHNGEVTLKVTVSEGKISAIEEVSQNETDYYWAKAKALFALIIEQQSAEVDTISGATKSSNAIKGAVGSALLQAVDSGLFDSGAGTEKNPYVIKTADQLKAFAASVDGGASYAGKYIVLDADIDISGSNWNPIGTEASAKENTATVFNGTFDGQGCTISGLTIKADNYTAETNAGLFSSLNNTARVKNLNLTDVDIDISSADAVLRAGGIAGDTVSGTNSDSGIGTLIDGCSAQGSIKVSTNGAKLIFGGGIVGRGNIITAITNCWTDVQVEAASKGGSQSAYAGGIMGMSGNNAKIINCITFGDQKAISPKSTNFGGMAGGIAAMYSGKAWNIGAAGNSTIGNGGSSHKWVGSLFGEITTSGMTKEGNSYVYPAAGNLRDYGYYDDEITLTIQKYVSATGVYDSSSETNLVPTGVGSITNDTVFANSDNVKSIADMSSEDFVSVMNGNLKAVTALVDAYGIQGVQLRQWQLCEGNALPTGDPWVNTEPDGSIFASGSGSAEDPYTITTKAQMQAFAGSLTEGIDYHGYHVALGADINISGENWTPVGGSDYAFGGTFDGCGHTISGMTQGEADAPRVIDNRVNPYMGLFGVLEKNATVKNLNLTNVAVYLKADKSFYLGGLAGMAVGKAAENGSTGALIDNVSIAGVLQGTTGSGNVLVGGIVGYQYRSNVINSRTDVDVYAEVLAGSAVAEAGGITALNNRGLIANCYTLGDESGKVSREDGAEGAPAIGGIAAVNGGWISNCYSKGNTEGTGLGAVYNGAVTGWITGTGSTYACWFNKDATMKADGKVLPEAVAVGTKVPAGVNDEGDAYTGGLADDLNGYALSEYPIIWEEMNKRFDAFPVDLTRFCLATNALKTWVYDSDQNVVTWGDEYRQTVYKQPEVEIVPKPVLVPGDGVWYGRNADKTTVVKVTVEGNAVTQTEVICGETNGEAYEEACKKAVEKATYGDTTDYSAPDAGRFAGGKGTEASPYLIRTEAQLRYLAEGLNEDNAWEDVYFKQTADIDVSSAQWLPIGWGIRTLVVDREKQYCVYPFKGHYDGDGHSVTGMTIGSGTEATTDIRAGYLAGLFGFISGNCPDNGAPNGRLLASVKNVNVKDAVVNVSSRYQNYVGLLAGFTQSGFVVDNCSVSGTVVTVSRDSFARGGGLIGSAMRGMVTDCCADVEVYAETDMGNTYAGGFYGMDNRVLTINCYALGNVTGTAGYTNKTHVGGFIGQAGGIHYNCYAAGDVLSLKDCTDVGGFHGRSAGINVDRACYWNTDAVQKNNNTNVGEKKAVGEDVSHHGNEFIGKTRAELSGREFADLLNSNKDKMSDMNEILKAEVATDSAEGLLTQPYYYEGDGSDLNEWVVKSGITVSFGKKEEGGGDPSGGGGSGGGTVTPEPQPEPEPQPSDDHDAGCPSKAFEDLDTSLWYHEGTDFVIENKMMNGVSDRKFAPNDAITRAMIVTILYRLEGSPSPSASQTPLPEGEAGVYPSFKDVETGSWYEAAVNWAAENNIVKGMSETTFAPMEKITREQLATILYRYNEVKNGKSEKDSPISNLPSSISDQYEDAGSVSDWAEDAFAWAVQTGLMKGVTETTLQPRGNATRAQAAVLMQRLCEDILK